MGADSIDQSMGNKSIDPDPIDTTLQARSGSPPCDSAVIVPGGEIETGPMHKEKIILYAAVETERASIARRDLDMMGDITRDRISLQWKSVHEYEARSVIHPAVNRWISGHPGQFPV